ncbi:hypothetical protein CRUP_026394 [Coryphaenoides rupestris]|nr:hypothetical protein CRUP_026394 [Coryphaenoides rupestris]
METPTQVDSNEPSRLQSAENKTLQPDWASSSKPCAIGFSDGMACRRLKCRRRRRPAWQCFTFSYGGDDDDDDHLKRKVRRRPFWGRGIIRKKKSYKKGIEEEEEEPEADTAGPCDSCLLQDEESSCDTMGPPQPNGHHAPSHVTSTEEESSNEPPVAAPAETPTPEVPAKVEEPSGGVTESRDKDSDAPSQSVTDGSHPEPAEQRVEPKPETSDSTAEPKGKAEEEGRTSGVDCVNGDSSMDSLDSSNPTKSYGGEGDGTAGPDVSGDAAKHGQLEEPSATAETGRETQVLPPQERCSEAEMADTEDCHKEGFSGRRRTRSQSEQIVQSAEKAEEPPFSPPPPPPPPPPLIVDHQRLSALLGALVRKSEGYSVDQLERLYSLLGQCVYQHRRDYDKTRLLEDMEERVQNFDTFL